MKILVTGATGFLGNYLIHNLLEQGIEVVATSRNREKAQTVDWYDNVTFIPFDINASENFTGNLYEHFQSPDKLIHLAWEGLPNYNADYHLDKNLASNFIFLESLIKGGLKDISVTGTCFEYGMKSGCLQEDMPANPSNSYAIAKDTLRKMLEGLNAEKGFLFKWIRLFYMYGKGQSASSLFTQLETALKRGDKVFNMSAGEQIRDFLPVDMVVDNIRRIALLDENVGIVNCCSGQPQTVKSFVENYLKENDKSIQLNLGYYPYPTYEPMEFWGDAGKMNTLLL